MTRTATIRYHSLDHWRGFACLMVVACHATFYAPSYEGPIIGADFAGIGIAIASRLWIGVPLFFVISGYCIAASADTTRRKASPARQYFSRRLWRIFPPYLACLFVTAAAVCVVDRLLCPSLFCDETNGFPRPEWMSLRRWIGNLSLTETWLCRLLEGRNADCFLSHAWTLCYEEQFYAVVGLSLIVSRRLLFPILGAITAGVLAIAVSRKGDDFKGIFFDGQWLLFAAGIGIYIACSKKDRLTTALVSAALLAGFAWSALQITHFGAVADRTSQERAVGFAFAMLLLALHHFDSRLADLRPLRPLSWCGLACYSLYLTHWPITKAISHGAHMLGLRGDAVVLFAVIPTCVVASLLVAWPFHVFVERRFMNSPTK